MRIALLGQPGSGKATQAAQIAERYGIVRLKATELLHGDGSAPVDEDPMAHYASRRLAQRDVDDGFIIGGFPRMLQQAMLFEDVLADRPLQMVLCIQINADVMIERLAGRRRCRDCGEEFNVFNKPSKLDDQCDACGGTLRQRVDDTERVIDHRLRVYEGVVNPVIGYYRAAGLLHDIDGAGTIDEVSSAIFELLDPLAKSRLVKRKRKAS